MSMAKKVLVVVLAVLAAVVAKIATQGVIDWLRREPAITSEVAARPWVEQVLLPGEVSLEVPWPLENQAMEIPPQLAKIVTRLISLSHEQDGLTVMGVVSSFTPETPIDLDRGADGALANLQSVPGTKSVDGKKHETTLLGGRAIEVEAWVERERGGPLQVRGVVFLRGHDLFQVLCVSEAANPEAAKTWERVQASIRSSKAP
jgi:hypothetical protein